MKPAGSCQINILRLSGILDGFHSQLHPGTRYSVIDSQSSWVYPRLEILRERPRESTDLEEYIVVEPKNIAYLQNPAKLQLFENPCNVVNFRLTVHEKS